MNIKSYKLLGIILILAVATFFVTGCGKSGNRFENQLPSISITSFEGWNNENIPANVDTLTHEYIFQQKIFWHATDPDGVITGYAFRVLDEDHQPITTPGYDYLADAATGLISDDLLSKYGEGWVLHYLPGAEQLWPLDDARAKRTIWTNQKYAVINFPAANENGEPMPTISYFEVLAIDNRGDITKESAKRKFRTNSNRPTCTISTTKGNPDGGNVGSGITLRFSMKYPEHLNMLVSPIPSKYEFKMMKIDNITKEVIPGTETEWYNTDEQEHINEYRLTRRTDPPLIYDYDEDGTSLGRFTRVIARAIDLAGVSSEMVMPEENIPPNWQVDFKVKPGFRPMTLIYSKKLLALGDKHFEDRNDKSTPEDLPYTIVQGEQLFATPLFKDFTNTYSVVHSNDLRVYVRWGWWGEYGKESSTGSVEYPLDNPYEKKFDSVLSEPDPETGYAGGENYYSEITHFDIRYDDEPYSFPPFPLSEHKHVDDDGTVWLRLPIYSPLRQSIVLTGNQISPGNHRFVVRSVDSQDEVSRNPAVIDFNVVPYVPASSRTGVLIIDDDSNHPQNSPEEIVNAKYAHMTSDIAGVTKVKYGLSGEGGTYKDARGRNLPFSELQKYKLVIYHADNPSAGGTFEDEIDGVSLFVREGGNFLLSHTSQFASKASDISNKGGYTLLHHMGLPMMPTLTAGPANPVLGAFFQNAIGNMGYPNLGLQYSTHPSNADGTPGFHTLIENLKGFSAVAYHNVIEGSPNILGDPIFKYGCKPTDFATSPPTQVQYDNLNGKVVGVRKINSNGGKFFTLTFPLSYMLDSDTKALINSIWSELQ